MRGHGANQDSRRPIQLSEVGIGWSGPLRDPVSLRFRRWYGQKHHHRSRFGLDLNGIGGFDIAKVSGTDPN